ncbi:hypothetical protein BOTBODRAFT_478130 [Botryobasidium botryosum FD-172 SS1]|uniref:Secreted protein n=1 Tax=Botryobasidium botryosum (strain FD-172 SS1) TaxID=930990 RepID=A0A067N562_BOTB1|nr:hypothetical protein BOTBODRAFT_478130 [Botryobasidium botryosum FD-172 SS1]
MSVRVRSHMLRQLSLFPLLLAAAKMMFNIHDEPRPSRTFYAALPQRCTDSDKSDTSEINKFVRDSVLRTKARIYSLPVDGGTGRCGEAC